MKILISLIFILISSGCNNFIMVDHGKRTEIRNALNAYIESGKSNLNSGRRFSVKKCQGICEGSTSSKYYIDIGTNACSGWIDIEEICTEGKCKYTFKENEIMVCS